MSIKFYRAYLSNFYGNSSLNIYIYTIDFILTTNVFFQLTIYFVPFQHKFNSTQ